MAEIISNQFTSTVSRTTTSGAQEILSNRFTATINRSSDVDDFLGDLLSTVVNIYKAGALLTPVNSTPTTGEYQVTITGTIGCTASVQSDYKTIKLNSVTDNKGAIDISINIENKRTYIKSIPVATITSTEDLNSSISQAQQTANKFEWIIQSGSGKSDMVLTDELYKLVSKNISLTADRIDLNGYVSNEEESWSISSDGLFNAKDMSIDGELSVDSIICNKINNPNYPESLSGNVQVYVNASTGSDDIEFEEGAVFQSVNGALEALPRCLNNWEVKIMLETNVTENITIRNKNTGRLYIQLNNKTLYGWIDIVQNMGLQVFLLGGTTGTASTSDYGYIKPTEGKVRTGGVFPIAALDTFSFTLYNIAVYAPTVDQSATKGALHVSNFTKAYINNLKIYHTLSGSTFSKGFDNMIRTYSTSYVYIAESHGLTKNYTYYAQSGSTICLNNTTQASRYNSTAITKTNSGGEIRWVTEPTWDGSGSTGSSDASSTVTTKTYTNTYKSNYGDTYRSTVYNNWKKDGTVRQGDWGYGDCTGCWFFGTQFADVKGKNITKVTITIARQSGGISSAREHKLWMHGHTSRPSGAPSLTSGWSKTFDLAVGNSTPITITDSAVLNAIKAGTCKGFALRHTYDNAHYSVCSGSVTVKITYTE